MDDWFTAANWDSALARPGHERVLVDDQSRAIRVVMLARLFKRVLDIEKSAGLLDAGSIYGRPWTYQRGGFLGEQADDAGDGGADSVARKTQRAT